MNTIPSQFKTSAEARAYNLAVYHWKYTAETGKPRFKPEDQVRRYMIWAGANCFPCPRQPYEAPKIKISLRRMRDASAAWLGVSPMELISARRIQSASDHRACFYYCARIMTPQTLEQIGRVVGDRDHTTVLHGIKKIQRGIKEGNELGKTAKGLLEHLKMLYTDNQKISIGNLQTDMTIGNMRGIDWTYSRQ